MYKPFETYRGFVYPGAIDQVGHMNVQSYTGRFDEATWHFLARLGFPPSLLKQQERSFVALDQRTQYKREVLVGSLLHINSELLEIRRKTVRFVHRMFDSETNEEVASTELVGVYFDMKTRKSLELPDDAADRANGLVVP
jgi:acyl-CoA thioester hydrolase